MALLVLIPCLAYAHCDEDESCVVDWDSKTPYMRNGRGEIDCGEGIHYFWVTKYEMDDVGPDQCVPPPMDTMVMTVPPGDEAIIDWPGYPDEVDPLNLPHLVTDNCWHPVSTRVNHYEYIGSAGSCPDYPEYGSDIYYTWAGTGLCCES